MSTCTPSDILPPADAPPAAARLQRRRPGHGYVDTVLWLPKDAIDVPAVKAAVTHTLASDHEVEVVSLWHETEHHLLVPRGFWPEGARPFPLVDCRPRGHCPTGIRARIQLDHKPDGGRLVPTGRTVQREAFAALCQGRDGVLQLACAAGKTVISLAFLAHLGVPTLVIVETTPLLAQWRERIEEFLSVPGGLGLIQGRQMDWQKGLVLATYKTLADRASEVPEAARRWFGLVVWDEGHHVPAPTFVRTATLFYGQRISLTATPTRRDGRHVLAAQHIGPVLYKNLDQELQPRVEFRATGIAPDLQDPAVARACLDCKGEMHMVKAARYLGTVPARLDLLTGWLRADVAEGRRILVLSKSVDALVNLLARWNNMPLYTEVPFPTRDDVGAAVAPVELDPAAERRLQNALGRLRRQAAEAPYGPKKMALEEERARVEQRLAAQAVYRQCLTLWQKRQTAYFQSLLATPSSAGLLLGKLSARARAHVLATKQVIFSILKYGREALDQKTLDTLYVCEPVSDPGALAQIIGRIQRLCSGTQERKAIFVEDQVPMFVHMCHALRGHLARRPPDEGGPLSYTNTGYRPAPTPVWSERP